MSIDYIKQHQEEQEKERKKSRILECQWHRQGSSYKNNKCEHCQDRFICHTMVAKQFEVVANESIYTKYRIFAEDEDEALELWNDYTDNDGEIVFEVSTDSYGRTIEIEQIEKLKI